MAADQTTIIFVPGAWHRPQVFLPTTKLLEDAGYNIVLIDLPSVGPPKHLPNMDADVQEIRKNIEKAAEAGQNVVVVGHSYGSIPSSEAIKGLDLKTRQAAGKPGGVTHLFFCAAFIIPEGQTLISAFGGNDLPWFRVSEDKMEVWPEGAAEICYNDLSKEEQDAAVAKLAPQSYQVMHSPVTYAAWRDVPSTYLYCTLDNAIPLQIQKMMVEEIAKGVNISTESVEAGHSPFIGKPKETAEAIRRAAGGLN
ncbi:putative hydrolase R7 [Pseudocercospora fuligena]|uniref:Putative hydrolase R7 n=1 Tax=Pseudocercospora fuligena TaxID=685502 RepID=A0A8H6RMX8_9PEZI|nr:putative hydrolase R7 [Pseudocercospora fuligena]